MDINQIIDAINATNDDQVLFMIEALSPTMGFFSTGKKLLYVVKDVEGYQSEGIETDFLSLQTHVHISAIQNDHTFENDDYNLILFKGELKDVSNIEAFVHLCRIHARNSYEIGFKEFFYSLIQIFQLPSEQSFINTVGLYGELKVIQYAYDRFGVDISDSWHTKGSKSKNDFSNGKESIEVKTTSSEDGKITIKHSQIFEEDGCWLAEIICDRTDVGESLEELILFFQEAPVFNSINFAINLEKEKKRISVSDYVNERFCTKSILFFKTEDVNPFKNIPDNVFSMEYKMDLSEEYNLSDKDIEDIFQRMV